ncbi:MAG: oligosaccharide flippase family protein [Bacteroidales bacterium]|nr:oligosaccharide flippase family protein [Bacteroidales bacterium]
MKRNGILKEALTLTGGNVLAQIIALAAYFVLTRIYSPDDYGLFNIFYSYIEVLIILSTCKYELAVVVASDDRQAAAVARFALRLNTLVSLALLTVALVLWLTGTLPGSFAQLGWMVLLIPPMVFFCGTSRIYSFLYNRFHRYTQIALSENVNAGAGALLKMLLGWLGMTPAGLPVGTVLGQAASNVNYRLGLRQLQLPSTDADERRAAAATHRNFPRYVATKDFVNTFSANLPFLWLAIYFDRAEVGLFGLALTFSRQPVLLLCSAFERVLYARGAEAVRDSKPLLPLTTRFVAIVNAVALPLCVAAWFLAESLFSFGFGSRWQGCGVYVQALLPWVWLTLTANSLMFVANVFSTQRTEFVFYLVQLALRVGAIVAGIAMGSFLLAIRLFSAASALICLSLLVWYLWQVARYDRKLKA